MAIVTEVNLCTQCYNERRLKQGERRVTASKWREMVELKAFRGRLWAAFGMGQFVRQMWECFTLEKVWARSVLADVEKERQNGTDGEWPQETRYKEELELVRHSSDLRFEGILMRRAHYAGKSGDWENYLEEFLKDRLNILASVKGERMLQ